jgi:glycine hydroxymethyltransferase
MREPEMKEIASILAQVILNTKPGLIESGPNAGSPSKTKHFLDAAVKDEVLSRVKALLDRFPVYPQLDLGFLQSNF